MVGALWAVWEWLKPPTSPLPENAAKRMKLVRLLETLDLFLKPVYLSILLLYKLAKIRVLQCQGIYLRIRLGQPFSKNGREWHIFQNISKESHNRKWPNVKAQPQPPATG
jgi:hypothetical protein